MIIVMGLEWQAEIFDGDLMPVQQPAIPEVWRAIDIYIARAYGPALPASTRARLDALRPLADDDFFASPAFERDAAIPPSRLSLRLGNSFYPHMKLTIERAPDHQDFLFKADTHDRHCCPAQGTRDHEAFLQLMEKNQMLAQAIESAWAEQHLPTFKTFLRDDLARRVKGDHRT